MFRVSRDDLIDDADTIDGAREIVLPAVGLHERAKFGCDVVCHEGIIAPPTEKRKTMSIFLAQTRTFAFVTRKPIKLGLLSAESA
jgi:hypothetical protein